MTLTPPNLTVLITDTAPVAVADVDEVTESTSTDVGIPTATGNVITSGAGADTLGADAVTVVGVVPGDTGADLSDDTGVGEEVVGAYGWIEVSADGTYTYTLDNTNPDVDALQVGERLEDVFTYTIQDADGDVSTTTVTITIHGANDAPVPVGTLPDIEHPDSTTVEIDVSVGFKDVDITDTHTYDINGLPPGLILDPSTGKITGRLDSSASQGGTGNDGKYPIEVIITDSHGEKATQTFTLTVTNPPPIATDNGYTVTEDAPAAVVGNVMSDGTPDSDPDGDVITATPVTDVPGSNGGLFTIGADGTIRFDPNGEFDDLAVGETRTTTYDYTITDADGATATATITVTVTGVNDAPVPVGTLPDVGQDDSTTVRIPTQGSFTDPDGSDTLTYTATNLPPGLTIDPNTGEITGTLTSDASQGGPGNDGVYLIEVTADDGNGGTVTQTFTFTVTNPPPVAQPDTGAVDADATLGVDAGNGVILGTVGTDTDIDGDPLTVIGVTTGTAGDMAGVGTGHVGSALVGKLGTLTLNADGSYTYVADQAASKALKAGETATDVFSYAISDGNGGTSFTTLTITVTGIVRALPLPPVSDPASEIYGPGSGMYPDSAFGSGQGFSRSYGRTQFLTEPPSVWEDGYHTHRVINLSIPLHPIVYVEVTVQREQALRELNDLRAMGSDLAAVTFGDSAITPNNRGLGMDPVLFVKHAVDAVQNEQTLLQGRTLGRDGRTSLSADNLLGNNSIFALDKSLRLTSLAQGREAPAPDAESRGEPVKLSDADAKPRGAKNFSEQLRQVNQPRFAAGARQGIPLTDAPVRTAKPSSLSI